MVSAANFRTAFGITGTSLTSQNWFHETGETVYRKSEIVPNKPLDSARYTIVEPEVFDIDFSGTEKYVDATLTTAAASPTTAYSPADDQLDDPLTPFFYAIQNEQSGKVSRKVHETDLYTVTKAQAYLDSIQTTLIHT